MINLIFCKEDCHRSVQRLNQEKNPATISQMNERGKEFLLFCEDFFPYFYNCLTHFCPPFQHLNGGQKLVAKTQRWEKMG